MKIKKSLVLIAFLLGSIKSFSATCTATLTGNWENPAVWSCGRVPLCTDNITIPGGFTVTITTNQDYNTGGCTTQTMVVTISGTLQFQTGKKLTLPVASVIIIGPGAKLLPGGGGGSSNLITIGTNDVWKAGDGPITGPAILTTGGLPIELIDFTGKCVSNGVQLNWSTASEENNDYFLIEKSTNSVEWNSVEKINSEGNSGSVKKYVHIDYETNTSEVTYYRLTQVDKDGQQTIFKMLDVNCKEDIPNQMISFPNPSATELNIHLSVNQSSNNSNIKLINSLGGISLETTINLNKGINTLVLPLDLKPGTYTILFTSDNISIPTQQFMVIQP